MQNLMSNFSELALSRMEMKKVTGGECRVETASGGSVGGYSQADAIAHSANSGYHYCCASCGHTTTWNSNIQ
jgi:hypothetical protein